MIKGKRKAAKPVLIDYFDEIAKDNTYKSISLSDQWSDTRVEKIFLKAEVIFRIHLWVEKSLGLNPVPEVGGFLWGNFAKKEEKSYWVSFEHFEAAEEIDQNSAVRLDFGTRVLQNMDDKSELHDTMSLTGWFHTHPGHTPYLSNTDLSTHDGFFLQPFQIAVVLDSLTKAFDTGFFSRKHNGIVNNKEFDTKWVSWKALLEDIA